MKILLTAFKGKNNTSNILLEKLKTDKFTKKIYLTNSFSSSEKELTDEIRNNEYDYIFSFGQKPGTTIVSIEKIGRRDKEELLSKVDADELRNFLQTHGVKAELSNDAGSYLCNHVYFKGLQVIEQCGLKTKMIFIHVPNIREESYIANLSESLSNYLLKIYHRPSENKNRLLEYKNVIWGSKCICGNECSILQNKFHPWDETDFEIILECPSCGRKIIIDKKKAEELYNQKIYGHFEGLCGEILDLGCGGGFLTRYLNSNNKIEKIYGLDIDIESQKYIEVMEKAEFINSNLDDIDKIFATASVDYIVSRDVFMFVEDTEKYFDDISRIARKGIRQMAWFQSDNNRMKNKLEPEIIAEAFVSRGFKVSLKYLDWYKAGYFIKADK